MILWFSHPLYFLSTLFNSEWNWNHLSFLMIRSHFKYLVSSHQKDTYQIISYKDIPNLFHCSVTNCSVVDLLSNQKCLDSPDWTMPFPSWPIQQLPDVVFLFHSCYTLLAFMLHVSCRMAICVRNCLSHKWLFLCFQQNSEHSSSVAAPSDRAAQRPPLVRHPLWQGFWFSVYV